jgi:REP element-mobilizing transposase RayT
MQFVTFRLADSLPQSLLLAWREELATASDEVRARELHKKYESFLDGGHGSCLLANPVAARVVQDTLLMYGESHYELHEWVVMPNHVHFIATIADNRSLSQVMQSIKGYSSRNIHLLLGGSGRLWQPDYFDRLVKNKDQFERMSKYIQWNPVKAKLCDDPKMWPYSSANRVARERVRSSG